MTDQIVNPLSDNDKLSHEQMRNIRRLVPYKLEKKENRFLINILILGIDRRDCEFRFDDHSKRYTYKLVMADLLLNKCRLINDGLAVREIQKLLIPDFKRPTRCLPFKNVEYSINYDVKIQRLYKAFIMLKDLGLL